MRAIYWKIIALYMCFACVQGGGSNVLIAAALELAWIYAVPLVTLQMNSNPP